MKLKLFHAYPYTPLFCLLFCIYPFDEKKRFPTSPSSEVPEKLTKRVIKFSEKKGQGNTDGGLICNNFNILSKV